VLTICVIQTASPPSYNTAAAYSMQMMTSPASRDSSSATKRQRMTTSASSETNYSTDSRLYRSDSNYSASQDTASLDLRPLDAPEINEVRRHTVNNYNNHLSQRGCVPGFKYVHFFVLFCIVYFNYMIPCAASYTEPTFTFNIYSESPAVP